MPGILAGKIPKVSASKTLSETADLFGRVSNVPASCPVGQDGRGIREIQLADDPDVIGLQRRIDASALERGRPEHGAGVVVLEAMLERCGQLFLRGDFEIVERDRDTALGELDCE